MVGSDATVMPFTIEPDILLRVSGDDVRCGPSIFMKSDSCQKMHESMDAAWKNGFSRSAECRPQPHDRWFEYEHTSIFMTLPPGADTIQVANGLVKVLQNEGGLQDEDAIDEAMPVCLKEEPAKLSLKATVFKGDEYCAFKARFYEVRIGEELVIEFMYRAGDMCMFQWVYGLAIKYYQSQRELGIVATVEFSAEMSTPQHCSAFGCSQNSNGAAEAIALIDTAGFAEVSDLQVEAARCLARATSAANDLHQLCNDRILDGFRTMLQSDALDVLWPAARALGKLGCQPEAQKWLPFGSELRKEVRWKAESSSTPQAVQKLLLSMVHQEVPQGVPLGQKKAQEKASDPGAVFKVEGFLDFEVPEPDDFLSMPPSVPSSLLVGGASVH